MNRALALLSGVLLAVSFPKFGHAAFAWVGVTPLIVAVALDASSSEIRKWRWMRLGLLTGVVYFGGTIYWVSSVMATYGGLPWWVGVLVAMLLACYLAVYVGLFAMALGFAVARRGVSGVWLAPFLWVIAEWLRATVLGGFPWVLLGTSQARVTPVVQFASVAGVYGLSWLIVLVSTATAVVTISRRAMHIRAAIGVAVLLAVIAGVGTLRVINGRLSTTGRVLRVGLVQGNVHQDVKWNPAFRDSILARYLDLSRQVLGAGAGLVMWPEASTPFYFDAESSLASPVRKLAVESHTPFLIGTDALDRKPDGKVDHIYNSAILVDETGDTIGRYRKMVLVPFGEYVPFQKLLFFIGPLVEAVSNFTPGDRPVVFDAGGRKFSVAICYESVYPWLDRKFVTEGSELLATITNDAWFGTSSAAYQHWDQGMVRAVENGRYVVRAANTGISGAVDPYGRVLAHTPLFEPAAITVDVRLLDGRTIYNRLGDVMVWASFVFGAAIFLRARNTSMKNEARL